MFVADFHLQNPAEQARRKNCFDFDVTTPNSAWYLGSLVEFMHVYIRGIFITLAERRLDDTRLLSSFELR